MSIIKHQQMGASGSAKINPYITVVRECHICKKKKDFAYKTEQCAKAIPICTDCKLNAEAVLKYMGEGLADKGDSVNDSKQKSKKLQENNFIKK